MACSLCNSFTTSITIFFSLEIAFVWALLKAEVDMPQWILLERDETYFPDILISSLVAFSLVLYMPTAIFVLAQVQMILSLAILSNLLFVSPRQCFYLMPIQVNCEADHFELRPPLSIFLKIGSLLLFDLKYLQRIGYSVTILIILP